MRFGVFPPGKHTELQVYSDRRLHAIASTWAGRPAGRSRIANLLRRRSPRNLHNVRNLRSPRNLHNVRSLRSRLVRHSLAGRRSRFCPRFCWRARWEDPR